MELLFRIRNEIATNIERGLGTKIGAVLGLMFDLTVIIPFLLSEI